MTNKKLGIILAVFILIIAVLSWYLLHSQESQEVVIEITLAQQCQENISVAQELPADQICTAEFREMTCPHDQTVIHGAPNGCVISVLTELGWVSRPNIE